MSEFITCNAQVLLRQIGNGTILATSGGRVDVRATGVTLPVRYGYAVTIDRAANDTYTVRRTFRRNSQTAIKGEAKGVHAEELAEVVYLAGCYSDPMPSL